MLYLHRNSLALWSKVVSPHRLSSVAPSNAPHLHPCLSSWWVWLSPLRAHRFELEAACGGICWSTIAISWLYFLLNWVGRKAQKLSKGRQGSVKAKDVTRSESLSKCEYLGCVRRVALKQPKVQVQRMMFKMVWWRIFMSTWLRLESFRTHLWVYLEGYLQKGWLEEGRHTLNIWRASSRGLE